MLVLAADVLGVEGFADTCVVRYAMTNPVWALVHDQPPGYSCAQDTTDRALDGDEDGVADACRGGAIEVYRAQGGTVVKTDTRFSSFTAGKRLIPYSTHGSDYAFFYDSPRDDTLDANRMANVC